jgi:hypothetical protein
MDAFLAEWPDEALKQDCKCLAAALRALADQVVPLPIGFPTCTWMDGYLTAQKKVRAKLLAIAAELRTTNDPA